MEICIQNLFLTIKNVGKSTRWQTDTEPIEPVAYLRAIKLRQFAFWRRRQTEPSPAPLSIAAACTPPRSGRLVCQDSPSPFRLKACLEREACKAKIGHSFTAHLAPPPPQQTAVSLDRHICEQI